VRRKAAVVLLAVLLAVGAYLLFFSGPSTVEPRLRAVVATAVIGTGPGAVGVAADGVLLTSQPPPEGGSVPSLPIDEPPASGRLAGPVLTQARVLGAAPAALRPCVEGSFFGESGVDVKLRSGIELRFGDASRVAEKWSSAAAVLADPSIASLDYVDLHSPGRPAVGGSSHTLPPAEGAAAGSCRP
jgi:Cell division protein FtsQ/DivIB, C-terminal